MKLNEIKSLGEASYSGNIGMMEMFKFYQIATDKQKAQMKQLLAAQDFAAAWKFLQDVTGMQLQDA